MDKLTNSLVFGGPIKSHRIHKILIVCTTQDHIVETLVIVKLLAKSKLKSLHYNHTDHPPTHPLRSPVGKRNFWSIFYVVVDTIGLETDFTLETNRKKMKENLLKSTSRLRKRAFFYPSGYF